MAVRVIPDLDDELIAALTRIEEVLAALAGGAQPDEETDEPLLLPGVLGDGRAAAAFEHIWTAVAPTQGARAVDAGYAGRLLTPDGRYEHQPLRLVDVDQVDVDALAAAAQTLGDPRAGSDLREALSELADSYRVQSGDLAAVFARVAGLLDLAAMPDTVLLAVLLAGADPAGELVLDAAGEAAYQRTVDRLNTMWADADPLTRWVY